MASDDVDHGARGGARHAFGGRRRVVALEHGDPGHRDAEHDALDDAVQDVVAQVHRRPASATRTRRRRRRSAARRPDSRRRCPCAENSAASSGIEITPPQKRGATTRAIGSTAIISIADELLGGLHQADLGGDRRAGAAREQQTRDHRAELAHQRQRHQHAERLGRRRSAAASRSPAAPSTMPTNRPDTRMMTSDSTPAK